MTVLSALLILLFGVIAFWYGYVYANERARRRDQALARIIDLCNSQVEAIMHDPGSVGYQRRWARDASLEVAMARRQLPANIRANPSAPEGV